MTPEVLAEFLAPWVAIETQGPHGEIQQRERVQAVAAFLATNNVAGDFVEIGCLHGSTTTLLAQVAREFGRRVIAVDPWEIGTQNCSGGEFEIFQRTMEPYADVTDLLRMRSDDPRAVEFLKGRPLALVIVDGLHEYEACRGDIQTVAHAAVIAVDDTMWSTECRKAFEDAAGLKARITCSAFRESWLV